MLTTYDTEQCAESVADELRARGHTVTAQDVAEIRAKIDAALADHELKLRVADRVARLAGPAFDRMAELFKRYA